MGISKQDDLSSPEGTPDTTLLDSRIGKALDDRGIMHLTYRDTKSRSRADRPTLDEIEVTPKMVEVGVAALEAARGALSDEMTVSEVYRTMRLASRRP